MFRRLLSAYQELRSEGLRRREAAARRKEHPVYNFSSGALDLSCEFAVPGGERSGEDPHFVCFDVVEPSAFKSLNCYMEVYSEESDTDDYRRKRLTYPQSSLSICYDTQQIAGVLYLPHPTYLHFFALMSQLLVTNLFTIRLLIEETNDDEIAKYFAIKHVLLPSKPTLTRRLSFTEKAPEEELLN